MIFFKEEFKKKKKQYSQFQQRYKWHKCIVIYVFFHDFRFITGILVTPIFTISI